MCENYCNRNDNHYYENKFVIVVKTVCISKMTNNFNKIITIIIITKWVIENCSPKDGNCVIII